MLKSFYQEKIYEAGCDEVGRGCLAGPVIAAAVILPKNYKNNNIKDSKKISVKKRKLLEIDIKNNAIDWSIGIVSNKKIDKINILNASILAMHNAIKKLKIKPNYLIIDGNQFKPYKKVKHTCIIQGDNKYLSIAAASIIA
ncbi:MAG: ribonuclease HII, partial [Bacteroidota bacterium]|nr:ribonuclease HII [Bacteroidota bacterium]